MPSDEEITKTKSFNSFKFGWKEETKKILQGKHQIRIAPYKLYVFIHGKHIGMLPYQTHVSSNCSPFLQMAMKKVMYIPPTRSPPHLGRFTWCSCE